jgi:hypothetical protein
MSFAMLFGSAETLLSTDTFHVKDYSKIVADALETLVDRKLKHQQPSWSIERPRNGAAIWP